MHKYTSVIKDGKGKYALVIEKNKIPTDQPFMPMDPLTS